MAFLKKNWIILLVVAVLIIAAVFYWKNKSGTEGTAESGGSSDWEKEVQRNVAWLSASKDQKQFIQDKATKAGVSFAAQVRKEAEWYAENNGFKRPA
jgi:hypothetical protein